MIFREYPTSQSMFSDGPTQRLTDFSPSLVNLGTIFNSLSVSHFPYVPLLYSLSSVDFSLFRIDGCGRFLSSSSKIRLYIMSRQGDFEAVRKEIASLLHQPGYDDGSAGPVLVRLAWYASTYLLAKYRILMRT
jgi:hypothetical protein